MTFVYALISALVVYLIVEGLWLGVIAKKSYQKALGDRLRERYKIWPWVVFYLIYTSANVHFTVMPNLTAESFIPTATNAFIFGVAGYGAYNLTCYSILKNWPLGITLKDWAWGTFSSTLSATAAWLIVSSL